MFVCLPAPSALKVAKGRLVTKPLPVSDYKLGLISNVRKESVCDSKIEGDDSNLWYII